VHLVCQNLHQIAKMYANPVLRIELLVKMEEMEILLNSSRIFKKLEIEGSCKYSSFS
jgi:hypothetical protein